MLPLLAFALLSGTPQNRLVKQPNLSRSIGDEAPLFAFAAPVHYAGYPAYSGLPATDGCKAPATVTGTKGEPLSFTRASARFCPVDTNETSGTMCTSGEVCLQSRGISIFRATNNNALRSEELENAAWTAANVTVTANTTVAADSALTAETLNDTSALSGTITQSITTTSATRHTLSVWLKGGTALEARLSLTGVGSSTGDNTCTITGLSTTAWRRYACTSPAAYGALLTAVSTAVLVGDAAADQGTIFAWGAQHEVGWPYASPYVATTSAGVARQRDEATFAIASSTPACVGVTWVSPSRFSASRNRMLGTIKRDATNHYEAYTDSDSATSTLTCYWTVAGAAYTSVSSNTMTAGDTQRLSCEYGGTNLTAVLNSTVTNTARSFTLWTGTSTYYVGDFLSSGSYEADGIISNIIIDSSVTRCR